MHTSPYVRMHRLSESAARLLSCSQVITTIWSVVKELVENSLDAGASSIDVRLENYGLGRIEVRDNGKGFNASEAVFIAQRHYTSKLSDFGDLKHLNSYGFRGEALGSLCSLSDICVTSRTEDQELGMTYIFDTVGQMVASKPSPSERGTTVVVQRLFKNVPVRRQMLLNAKKQADELNKVRDLLMAFGLIYPFLRLRLQHNQSVIWQKCKACDYQSAFSLLFGSSAASHMQSVKLEMAEVGMTVCGILPKIDADSTKVFTSNSKHCVIAVNNRPVDMKSAHKVLCHAMRSLTSTTSKACYPLGLLHLVLDPSVVDVNMEPNKHKVEIQREEDLITALKKQLELLYAKEGNERVESIGRQQQNAEDLTCISENNVDLGVVLVSPNGCHNSDFEDEGLRSVPDTDISVHDKGGMSRDQNLCYETMEDISDAALACVLPSCNSRFRNNPRDADENTHVEDTEKQDQPSNNVQTDSEEVNAVDWSMGRGVSNSNGNLIEPVKIFTAFNSSAKASSVTKLHSMSHESAAKKQKMDDERVQQAEKSLSGVSKKAAGMSARDQEQKPSKDLRRQTKAPNVPSVYGLMQKAARERMGLRHKFTKQVKFSLSSVKERVMNMEKQTNVSMLSSPEVKVIGSVDENALWIIQKNHQLLCFDCVRAKECALFDKLMDQHSISHQSLDDAIALYPEMLGGAVYWERLMSMEWSTNPWDSSRLCEDVLVKSNGFLLKQIISQKGSEVLLMGVAAHLPHYGVADLKQILVSVVSYEADNGCLCPLTQSRPIKVETFLKNEGARLAKSSRHAITKSEAFSLFQSGSFQLRFCCSLVEFENESFNAASQTSAVWSDDAFV